jgi:hypothetical protein
MSDIFQFWDSYSPPHWLHPEDRVVLAWAQHGFNKRCLPTPFTGPLREALVTLLYLNPALSDSDNFEFESATGRLQRLSGWEPLPGPDEHPEGWKFWSNRTKIFGDWKQLRSKVAILQLCPYHSKSFDEWSLLPVLRSSRAAIEWANDVLFPQAEDGDRIVICLRSHKYWGLKRGQRYKQGLFAPATTMNGYIEKTEMRGTIINAVREILGMNRG